MPFVRSLLICAVLGLSAGVTLSAQAVSLTGRVLDAQGAAVSGADVSVTGAGQSPRSVKSTPSGSFDIPGLPSGSYTVRVDASGFATSVQTVTVDASTAPLSITLAVGAVTEDVTVRGAIAGTAATGKTTLPIRELPLTVQSVGADIIAEQGVNDLVSALRNVPGVNAFTTYGVYEYYSFRGFLDSVQLVDGVRNEGNRINTQLTNIDRVEVLKGPASALYGGAALGATVNLIRKKPSLAPQYDFSASVGTWQMGRGTFGATGRLGNNSTLYRLDAGVETKDGYRHNETRRVSVTPSFAWRIADANQLNVYYTFNRDRFAGDAGLPLVDTGFGVPVEENVPAGIPRDRNYRTPQDGATSYDNNLQVVFARQLTNAIGFRNTTSYRPFNDQYFLTEGIEFIAPRTIDRYYLYFHHHRRPLMNLAEITGTFTRGLEQNIVVGWEAQRYHNYTDLPDEDFFSATSIDAFDPVETQGPSDLTITRSNVFTHTNQAFYAQDHITLAPQLKVLVGGRFDVFRRRSYTEQVDGDTRTPGNVTRRETEAFTGRAGVVYQPSRFVDLYGSLANSFKPLTQAQPDGTTLDPETGTQLEFGQRFHALGDRVQINTALYRILRQNVAFSRPGNRFEQAGEVRSRGFEADVQTAVAANWRVTAGYAFTDAEFLDYQQSLTVNLRGNTPVFVPRHTFNLWTGYQWENGFGVNVGARYFGKTFADNTNQFEVDGYGTLNVGLRYTRGLIEYALNLNNLTDTDYFIPHQDYAQVYPGDPVNVLATLRVRLR